MLKAAQAGFTLVEILVVLSITTVIGAVIFANFGSFREDQALNNASDDLGSLVHLAQTNAISAVKCNNVGDATWSLEFKTNRVDIDLKCTTTTATVIKTLQFKGTTIDAINGSGCNSSYQPGGTTNNITVQFAALYGTTTYTDGANPVCFSANQNITIILKNTKTGTTKSVTINKGGTLD